MQNGLQGDPSESVGLNGWISLAEGQFWLAAGLTCTAFQVLNIQAVATLSWGSQDTKLGVFADCIAKYPLSAKNDDELFLLVELGIVTVMPYTRWFFTINFNVHFGASVHLHGPPMAGYVFVDWNIISFTIQFGDSAPQNNPLSWDKEWALLKQIDSPAGGGGGNDNAAHVFAATGGFTTSPADAVSVTEQRCNMDCLTWSI
ncbi:hypothetical protein TSTA_079130 [Talaromyces stipitatus ATCC 10500]|uniref:DUF6603 domain-containing protein n=1 Tax=Talaromyces stipitatus (strain ATCC 10500 / CBS 375.48 / QM 6759 / NRRL 1006) TaxID=441959 RepID=B8LXQ6_TALSN|nr:uncharacterized protein TSTA_079130 [Talaromyces stipitatus ATCC 10500]EED24557.1 hypothetical protein TSTA_079130 [Talaromyces stipitatus ATCC 10500]